MKKKMKLLILCVSFASVALLAPEMVQARGGHYAGGHGSSHKGGHYKNARTGDHYEHRK